MFKRDYIKDEIDRLGEFLKKLLEKILNLPGDTSSDRVYSAVDQGMSELLNKSLKEALVLEEEDFLNMVVSETQNIKSIETLAEVFYVLASKGHGTGVAIESYKKSLKLYQHVLDNSTTYSFEIHQKVGFIKGYLNI